MVGVGAVVLYRDCVLLVKRARAPLRGEWSLPGGVVELGETLEAAVVREMREETGLDVDVGPVIEVLDRVQRLEDGRVEFHYVIIDYLCSVRGGALAAASDAEAACFARLDELQNFNLTERAREVIARAADLSQGKRA